MNPFLRSMFPEVAHNGQTKPPFRPGQEIWKEMFVNGLNMSWEIRPKDACVACIWMYSDLCGGVNGFYISHIVFI